MLSGLYWLYLWPAATTRERVRTAALAVSAPLIWAGTDWIVTGDPLHSLHGTAALAEEADRRRSIDDVPYWTAQYFGFALREPLLLGIPIGLAFAWVHARRRAALPLVAVVAMIAVFAAGPLFGLPLIRRYVDTPDRAALPVLRSRGRRLDDAPARARAHDVDGGRASSPARSRSPTCRGTSRSSRRSTRRVQLDGVLYRHLQRAAEAPRVRAAFANCGPLTTGDHRPIPFLRYWLGGDPGSVGTVASGASPMGRMLLLPRRGRTTGRIYNRAARSRRSSRPSNFVRIYRNRSWRVYAVLGCVPPRA